MQKITLAMVIGGLQDVLREENRNLSEKVIRRLMHEEGCVVKVKRTGKYNSYAGEVTLAVPNLIERELTSDSPEKKLLTNLTEFVIPAGKVYLSPMMDCFAGKS